ncbi:MAG: hypothetical protein SWO11_16510 [Thermodesulfobacteriota bacterium]|nr:hypothetical protein [Thermodesulfobacteriota bacterium]
MKRKVQIFEVAPWKGLQCESKYVAADKKVELIKRISQYGIKKIIATSFAHPRFFPQFFDSEQVMTSLICINDTTYLKAVPNEIGCRQALASGVKEIAVWVSSSETHNVKSLKTSIVDTMKEIQLISKICKENNFRIRSKISTAFGCLYENEIPIAVIQEVALRLNKLGCYEVCLTIRMA